MTILDGPRREPRQDQICLYSKEQDRNKYDCTERIRAVADTVVLTFTGPPVATPQGGSACGVWGGWDVSSGIYSLLPTAAEGRGQGRGRGPEGCRSCSRTDRHQSDPTGSPPTPQGVQGPPRTVLGLTHAVFISTGVCCYALLLRPAATLWTQPHSRALRPASVFIHPFICIPHSHKKASCSNVEILPCGPLHQPEHKAVPASILDLHLYLKSYFYYFFVK